jgi:prepilin-type N-terminal cleavage/methylation domain-containing protein
MNCSKRGFSLVEMMVAAGIAVVLTCWLSSDEELVEDSARSWV